VADEGIRTEVYADTFQMTTTPFGVNMTFGVREPHPAGARQAPSSDLVVVRMSPEHAKVMAMMMRKQLKQHEEQNGITIQVPHTVYAQLGLAEEDWGNI